MLSIFKAFKRFFSFLFISLIFIGCQGDKKQTSDAPKSYVITGETQGTTYAIKYFTSDQEVSKQSIDSLLREFDLSLSTYIPDSKISKINLGDTTIVLDQKMIDTYKASERIYEDTNGLFDPTIGVLVNAYGFGPSKNKQIITEKLIDSLLTMVGFDKVKLTEDAKIIKTNPNIYFDFNAIAQGYSVDVVADFLNSKGIINFMVEIGGEIRCQGTNLESNKSWIIGVEDPTKPVTERTILKKIKLDNLSLATSGNYRKIQTDSISGEKYVHTIHPKTGKANKSNILSATILADNCMDADGYATALMLMNLEEGKAFFAQKPNLYGFIIYQDNSSEIQYFQTENLTKLILE